MRMADGTIKPSTRLPARKCGPCLVAATGRWGRSTAPAPLNPDQHDAHCAFCARRYLETPPEKARLIRTGNGFATHRQPPAPRRCSIRWPSSVAFPIYSRSCPWTIGGKTLATGFPTLSPPTSATIWPRKRVAATSCKSWSNG